MAVKLTKQSGCCWPDLTLSVITRFLDTHWFFETCRYRKLNYMTCASACMSTTSLNIAWIIYPQSGHSSLFLSDQFRWITSQNNLPGNVAELCGNEYLFTGRRCCTVCRRRNRGKIDRTLHCTSELAWSKRESNRPVVDLSNIRRRAIKSHAGMPTDSGR